MEKWIDNIKKNNLYRFSQPADITKIKNAEKHLLVEFAPDYVDLLQCIGSCMCFGHEINGLTEKENLNVILATEEQREKNPDIPADWYAIEDTHMDGIVIWQNKNSEIYQSKPGSPPQKIASNLEQLINI